ncbi:odorant receptor 131-2-like [Rhinophrynus dorsalis]
MINSTILFINVTSGSTYDIFDIVRETVLSIMILSFFFFLYIITVILGVYFTNLHVREAARYTLFAHMLINDTVNLFVSLFLFTAAVHIIYLPVPICCIMATFSTASFLVTPYNLAVMSLERYIAICYPLRHFLFCNGQRCRTAIWMMWAVGIIPIIFDFIVMSSTVEKSFFSITVLCYWSSLSKHPVQNTMRSIILIFSFTTVGLIIFYTYVQVMLVSRKIGSRTSSASKAGKTVMLHAFQLLLCMTSFTSAFTETYFKEYYELLPLTNFILFLYLPRVISPLIYGIRDEVFRKSIRKLRLNIYKDGLSLT